MKLFLYEYASARPAAAVPASIRREGAALLAALHADAQRLVDVEAVTLSPCSAAAEKAGFLAVARQADAAVILAPEFDNLLVERVRWVQEAGCRHLGCSLELVERAGDEWSDVTQLFRRRFWRGGIRRVADYLVRRMSEGAIPARGDALATAQCLVASLRWMAVGRHWDEDAASMPESESSRLAERLVTGVLLG